MSIGPIGRGAPSFSPLGMPSGGGAGALAQAGGSPFFARDSFQPAAAAAGPAGAQGGGMDQLMGSLQKVVEALGKIVDMLKGMLGGGAQPQGAGAGGGGGGAATGSGWISMLIVASWLRVLSACCRPFACSI